VALYDYTATSPSTLLLYADSVNVFYQSANSGSTWTALGGNAPWSARQTATLTAELEGGVYLVGGQGFGDAFYSVNKGLSWTQLIAVTSPSSTTGSVVLSSTTTACSALVYSPSTTAPNGYHRQLVLYGGSVSVYASSSPRTSTVITYPTCSCNPLPGVRGLAADLVFLGESFSISGSTQTCSGTTTSTSTGGARGGQSSSSAVSVLSASPSSSTGSTTGINICPVCQSCGTSSSGGSNLSKGAIAGIVIGSVVGVALILCAIFYFILGSKRAEKWKTVSEPHGGVELSRTNAGESRRETEEERGHT
jgi:hypothetical protein